MSPTCSVVGSRSGSHGGTLEAYSTGTGESFLPVAPVRRRRAGDGARARQPRRGAPAQAASTTFTIAHQAAVSQKEFPTTRAIRTRSSTTSPRPTLTPSTVRITTPRASPARRPGDLFLAPYQGEGTAGPMIVDQDGTLVWFHPLPAGDASTNFQVQQYEGKPVLTWWQGRILEARLRPGRGRDLQHLLSARRARARPATATAPTCTSSA